MTVIDRELFKKISTVFTTAFNDDNNRRPTLSAAFRDAPQLMSLISFTGAGHVFATNLITKLENFGSINHRHSILYALDEIEDRGLANKHATLIAEIRRAFGDSGSSPNPSPDPTQPPVNGQTYKINQVNGENINIGGEINIYVYGNAPGVPPPPQPPDNPTENAEPPPPPTRDQIFISYSHRETEWLHELMLSLKPRMRQGAISVWNDETLEAGDRWREKINRALASARVGVLLVSRHFLASDFIMRKEWPTIKQAADRKALRIIWVPVTYSSVTETDIAEYQVAGRPILSPSNTLDKLTEAEKNEALELVARDIVKAYNAFDDN